MHGVTTEDDDANAAAATALVEELMSQPGNAVVVHPNNDPGSDAILASYERLRADPRFRLFPSLRFEAFLTLLRHAHMLVGNSSAGIREAPIYGIPSVDIGSRQRGRAEHPTIVHVGTTRTEIASGIAAASAMDSATPSLRFGAGDSAERFCELLASDEVWARGVDKVFRDLLISED